MAETTWRKAWPLGLALLDVASGGCLAYHASRGFRVASVEGDPGASTFFAMLMILAFYVFVSGAIGALVLRSLAERSRWYGFWTFIAFLLSAGPGTVGLLVVYG